jgi:hypothetical protein
MMVWLVDWTKGIAERCLIEVARDYLRMYEALHTPYIFSLVHSDFVNPVYYLTPEWMQIKAFGFQDGFTDANDKMFCEEVMKSVGRCKSESLGREHR